MPRVLRFLCLLLLWSVPAHAEPPAEQALASIFLVVSEGAAGKGATGSGFVVGKGVILTNNHVVEGYDRYMVVPALATTGQKATLLWTDKGADLALLSVPGLGAEPLTLATQVPAKGKTVWAVGFTGVSLRFQSTNGKFDSSVTEGVRSNSYMFEWEPGARQVQVIEHSAEISGGNSGGPLFDDCNRVIGINTAEPNPETSHSRLFLATAMSEVQQRLLALSLPTQPVVATTPCTAAGAQSPQVAATTTPVVDDASGEPEYPAEAEADPSTVADDEVETGPLDRFRAQPGWVQAAASIFAVALLLLIGRIVLAKAETPIGHDKGKGADAGSLPPVQTGRADVSKPQKGRYVLHSVPAGTAIVIDGSLAEERQGFCLGRHPDFVDHVLKDQTVSRRHLRVCLKNNRLHVEDLNSTHGTFVDGRRLKPFEREELFSGAGIRLGDRMYRFEQVQG